MATLDDFSNATKTRIKNTAAGLQSQIDGKADDEHSHAVSDVTNLQSVLNDRVRADASQSFNDVEKERARDNIGAVSRSDTYVDLVFNGDFAQGLVGWRLDRDEAGLVFRNDLAALPAGAFGAVTAPNGIESVYDFPVKEGMELEYSIYLREGDQASGNVYVCTAFLDRFGNNIHPFHYCYLGGTLTTLSQDLSPGDTVVHLTDISPQWVGQPGNDGKTPYMRFFIFWDYVDEGGTKWPPLTYSRYQPNGSTLWDLGAVDPVAKTITLNSPWSGQKFLAGHPVSNGENGGTYYYPSIVYPEEITSEWKKFEGTFAPKPLVTDPAIDRRPLGGSNVFLPPGVTSIRPLVLIRHALMTLFSIKGVSQESFRVNVGEGAPSQNRGAGHLYLDATASGPGKALWESGRGVGRSTVWRPVGGTIYGVGSPLGVVSAPVGTKYVDEAGTLGAWEWLKKTGGTGNTGWEVIHGDTGRVDVRNLLINGWEASHSLALLVSRIGNMVTLTSEYRGQTGSLQNNNATSSRFLSAIPGFHHGLTNYSNIGFATSGGNAYKLGTDAVGTLALPTSPTGWFSFTAVWPTSDPWPTTLDF